MSRSLFAALTLSSVALLSAACGETENPIDPTPPRQPIVEPLFTGTLTINGGVTKSFTSESAGDVTASLTTLDPDTATIGLALGTWNGTSCQIVIANDNAKQGAVEVGYAAQVGSLCVRVYDVGQLTAPVDFEVRIEHY